MATPAPQPHSVHSVKPAPPDADDRRNAFTPSAAFIRQKWTRNAGYVFGILCLTFAVWQMARMAEAQSQSGYEFVVGEDKITWGKHQRLNPDSEVYKRFLRDVARLRLNLTPVGLKYPEDAALVFTGEARTKLDVELRRWIERAQKLNLFADPYLEKIEVLPPKGDHPIFRISGFALVTGMGGSLPIRDKEPWFMSLELRPNTKIGQAGAQSPFEVLNYDLIFGKAEIEKARAARR
jgi:hypothetical protein